MELLSPAGNTKHIDVAINKGSDAVYGGLKRWNARHKAMNFSVEEYNESVKKLHENNIKFYLTLNILVLDKEIEEIINFLKDKNTELPDAFIVADVGLILKLKEEFPNIPLHFSTQFGAHCIDDLKTIESIGGERAILARELTLTELKNLKENTSLELECFVWGSQCLSYSGLCFFGSLINAGNGNRGKCIITCRDVYTANENYGNLLYVPDLDCINMISNLDELDCIKLEGRRRNPGELETVIEQIKNNEKSKIENGFMYGLKVNKNNLYEIINSRLKPLFKPEELENINTNDVFAEYEEDKPVRFCKPINKNNVFYIYSEYKNNFDVNKKNLQFELKIDDNIVQEVLYVNYKGEGKTFYNESKSDLKSFSANDFSNELGLLNDKINTYKIRYKRNKSDKYYISIITYNEILDYVKEDCKDIDYKKDNSNFSVLKNIYIETDKEEVIKELINNKFVKLIYNLASFDMLKNIKSIVDKYGDKIIYKLPLFNWKSEETEQYYKVLKNKDVMFTRISQIISSSDINFRTKYIDYTVYVWNKYALDLMKKYNIKHFTASPELSYFDNIEIFKGEEVQFVIGGKLPLVYTRQCFEHIYDCNCCINTDSKLMTNSDKGMDFEVICFNDNRILVYNKPVLNDYSKVPYYEKASFRYVTYGQSIEEIKQSVKLFEEKNYYSHMKKNKTWKDSYENDIIGGRY